MIPGIHAREWVSPTSGLYTIHQIIQNHLNSRNGNPFDEDVVGIDWYIMPLLNPDGYEYSHTHDRMWRKNRSPEGKMKISISSRLIIFEFYYSKKLRIDLMISVLYSEWMFWSRFDEEFRCCWVRGRCFFKPLLQRLQRKEQELRNGNTNSISSHS